MKTSTSQCLMLKQRAMHQMQSSNMTNLCGSTVLLGSKPREGLSLVHRLCHGWPLTLKDALLHARRRKSGPTAWPLTLTGDLLHARARKLGPTAPSLEPQRFCTAWALQKSCSGEPQKTFRAAGACAYPWRALCTSSPQCCCWTSPPTTWTSEQSYGWRWVTPAN